MQVHQKIRGPEFKLVEGKGRYFYCPHCKFCADRDYIGALNVYRRYRQLHRWLTAGKKLPKLVL